MDTSVSSAAQSAAEVADALAPRTAEVSADIVDLIVREIPDLRSDSRVRALLQASVGENVTTVLHVLQHGIDVEHARTPTAAAEYARRLAQRGVPMTALLRAYRIGSTRFQDWCLRELGRRVDDGSVVSATALLIAGITGTYIDQVSEEIVFVYEAEKGNWLRNRSVAQASRVRALLSGERVDLGSAEAALGYRLQQRHVGVVCWAGGAGSDGGALARLEHATGEVARWAECAGRPIFLPQDESTAWAWLPLGARDGFAVPAAHVGGADTGIRFAFGAVGFGLPGFRRTHRQALGAQAVAVAAGAAAQPATSFEDVAPLALMSDSIELIRAWVVEILGSLADDDEPNARLRETLRVFLQENRSFKATAERLTLHKNTVQYRVRKAEKGLGRPVDENRLYVELALLASHWLGAAVLRQPGGPRA
ncbi:MAG TPA: helix-turn-helix domain-containing protein [Actinoplanes sp.]|nr:helix-turn-helix domain-containing protein [Actinoplanes sp.]